MSEVGGHEFFLTVFLFSFFFSSDLESSARPTDPPKGKGAWP